MFCTEKERKTCNVEKMGCEGCFYENELQAIKILEKRNKEIEERNESLLCDIYNNFIAKSKVKEKIEEITESMNKAKPFDISYIEYCEDRIEVLEELLKGGD